MSEASTSNLKVLKSGNFFKRGNHIQTWHRRFFILFENGLLEYYTKESKTEQSKLKKGSIDLTHLQAIDDSNVVLKHRFSKNEVTVGLQLQLNNTNRVWHFCFDNDWNRNEWRSQFAAFLPGIRDLCLPIINNNPIANNKGNNKGNDSSGNNILSPQSMDTNTPSLNNSSSVQSWSNAFSPQMKPPLLLMDDSSLSSTMEENGIKNGIAIFEKAHDIEKCEKYYFKLLEFFPSETNFQRYESFLTFIKHDTITGMNHFLHRFHFYGLPMTIKDENSQLWQELHLKSNQLQRVHYHMDIIENDFYLYDNGTNTYKSDNEMMNDESSKSGDNIYGNESESGSKRRLNLLRLKSNSKSNKGQRKLKLPNVNVLRKDKQTHNHENSPSLSSSFDSSVKVAPSMGKLFKNMSDIPEDHEKEGISKHSSKREIGLINEPRARANGLYTSDNEDDDSSLASRVSEYEGKIVAPHVFRRMTTVGRVFAGMPATMMDDGDDSKDEKEEKGFIRINEDNDNGDKNDQNGLPNEEFSMNPGLVRRLSDLHINSVTSQKNVLANANSNDKNENNENNENNNGGNKSSVTTKENSTIVNKTVTDDKKEFEETTLKKQYSDFELVFDINTIHDCSQNKICHSALFRMLDPEIDRYKALNMDINKWLNDDNKENHETTNKHKKTNEYIYSLYELEEYVALLYWKCMKNHTGMNKLPQHIWQDVANRHTRDQLPKFEKRHKTIKKASDIDNHNKNDRVFNEARTNEEENKKIPQLKHVVSMLMESPPNKIIDIPAVTPINQSQSSVSIESSTDVDYDDDNSKAATTSAFNLSDHFLDTLLTEYDKIASPSQSVSNIHNVNIKKTPQREKPKLEAIESDQETKIEKDKENERETERERKRERKTERENESETKLESKVIEPERKRVDSSIVYGAKGSLYIFYDILCSNDKHFPCDLNMFDILILIWMCYKCETFHLNHEIRRTKLFCFRILFVQLFKEFFKNIKFWKDKLGKEFSLILHFDNLIFDKYHPSIQFNNESKTLVIPNRENGKFEIIQPLPGIKFQVILNILQILQDSKLSYINDKVDIITFVIESGWFEEYNMARFDTNNDSKEYKNQYTSQVYESLHNLRKRTEIGEINQLCLTNVDFEFNRIKNDFFKYYFETIFKMNEDAKIQRLSMQIFDDIKSAIRPKGKIIVRQDHNMILTKNWFVIGELSSSSPANANRYLINYEFFKLNGIDLAASTQPNIDSLDSDSDSDQENSIYSKPHQKFFQSMLFEKECVNVMRILASQIYPTFAKIINYVFGSVCKKIRFQPIPSTEKIMEEILIKKTVTAPIACDILDYVTCMVSFDHLKMLDKALMRLNIFSSNTWESDFFAGIDAIKYYQNENVKKMSDLRMGFGVNYRRPRSTVKQHSDLFDLFGPLYRITHRIDCIDCNPENNDLITIDNFRFITMYIAISHPNNQSINFICRIILTFEGCAQLMAEKQSVIDSYSTLLPHCKQTILNVEKSFEIKDRPRLAQVFGERYPKHEMLRRLCLT